MKTTHLLLIFCISGLFFFTSAQYFDILLEKGNSSVMKSEPTVSSVPGASESPGIYVGLTEFDLQMNYSVRRYILKSPSKSYHFYWTYMTSNDQSTRRSYYRYFSANSTWSPATSVDSREWTNRMGAISQLTDGRAVVAAHATDTFDIIRSYVYIDSSEGGCYFTHIELPFLDTAVADSFDQPVWPNVIVDSNNTIFIFATQQSAQVGWWTCSKDTGKTWKPWSDTLAGTHLGADNWASADAGYVTSFNNRVALISNSQAKSRLRVYETEDQGVNWKKTTIYGYPEEEADSLKMYNWYSGVYDKDYNLHVVYTMLDTTADGMGGSAGSGWRSHIRYWNSTDKKHSLLRQGTWKAFSPGCGVNHPIIAEPNIAINRDEGTLYCTWTEVVDNDDLSDLSYNNLEIFGAKSTDNGATWTQVHNITNSQSPQAIAGACEHDWFHSTIETVQDDKLEIFYMNDKSTGSYILSDLTDLSTNPFLFYRYKMDPVDNKNMYPIKPNHLEMNIYPNPFKYNLVIRLSQMGNKIINENAKLSIFTSQGRLVKQLHFKDKYIWDGTDTKGLKLPMGIYMVQVQGKKGTFKTKVILAK